MALFGFTTLSATPSSPTSTLSIQVEDTSEWPTAPFVAMIRRPGVRPRGSTAEAVTVSSYNAGGAVTLSARAIAVGGTQTIARSLKRGDECYPINGGAGSASVENGTGILYPVTIAGIQAAHDSALFNGGEITIPAYSSITSLGTTLTLTKAGTKLMGNFSTIKAPANGNGFVLVQVGAGASAFGLSSLLTVNADHSARTVTVVSTAGFAEDDDITITNVGGLAQPNRVRKVLSATVLQLTRPISKAMTTAATGVVGKYVAFKERVEIHDLHIDNNGNTNPGVITGYVPTATTTFTGNLAVGATTGTLTSAGSFNNGDYILIEDSGKVSYGQAVGWITVLSNKVGSTFDFNGPVPFAVTAATATVKNLGTGAQLHGNIGVSMSGCAFSRVVGLTGKNITGSLLWASTNYANEYHNVVPLHCGFPYNGSTTATGGVTTFYEMGTHFGNVHSDAGISWGLQINGSYQLTGLLGAVGCYGRGIKYADVHDCMTDNYGFNNNATGLALSEGSCFNMMNAKLNGNGSEGLWVSDQSNLDNYMRIHSSGNVTTDASMGPTDLRTIIEILNDDAVNAISRGIIRSKAQSVAYAAGNLTASTGTFTVAGAGSVRYDIKLDGHRATISFQIVAATVSATPLSLRLALPAALGAIEKTTQATISAINNSVEMPSAIASAEVGLTYIKFFSAANDLFGGAAGWATAAGTTYLVGTIEVELA